MERNLSESGETLASTPATPWFRDPVTLIPAAACVSLLISSVVVSGKKPLWNDEMLSLVLLQDPSFTHMMGAWGDTFNQAPPLYFVLGWLWDKLAGSSDVSLRLFGSAALSVALLLTWLGLRKVWGSLPAAIGTVSVYCFVDVILYHNAEVRMYGLFAATCAAGFLVRQNMAHSERVALPYLVWNALVQAAIVLTHLYGLLYSGALLVSLLIADRLFRRPIRLKLYASFVTGWLFLLPFVPGLINQSRNKAQWLQAIGPKDFAAFYMITPDFRGYLVAVLLLYPIIVVLSFIARQSRTGDQGDSRELAEVSTIVASIGFLLVPVVAWCVTLLIRPVLLERYILPTVAISWAVAMTVVLAKLLFPDQSERRFSIPGRPGGASIVRCFAIAALTLPALAYPLYYARHYPDRSPPGQSDPAYGYGDLPIAMEAGHDYLPRIRYAKKPERYFHIRDWDVARHDTGNIFATGDYTHLSALARHYAYIQSVQGKRFLSEHDRFLVWDEPDQKWFEWRIRSNPAYRVTPIAKEEGSTGPLQLFLVEQSIHSR